MSCLTGEGVGIPHLDLYHYLIVKHGQLAFASLVDTRYPLMLQLGELLPQLTPGPHLNSWVDWSNVSKISCSRKQQQQVGMHVCTHTHTHTHARTHAHTHTHTILPQVGQISLIFKFEIDISLLSSTEFPHCCVPSRTIPDCNNSQSNNHSKQQLHSKLLSIKSLHKKTLVATFYMNQKQMMGN